MSKADEAAKRAQDAIYELAKMAWKSEVLYGCQVEGGLFRHYKNGEIYRLLFDGVMDCGETPNAANFVVYKHEETGVLYCRPRHEFYANVEHKGRLRQRFERLPYEGK